jgi:eukaryotic-like serine/threonine-protein kinase
VSLKKLGRYDLIRVLGKGAMGVVYEGRDPNLDRRVAIKTVKVENLTPEATAEYEARFRTEARSAARLQHPNIVSVYDSDQHGDIAYLVMEYVQGDDLKHHLDSGVRYPLEQSVKMMRDLLAALDYAHTQGVIHRDVKPGNLLIEPGGRLKLTDFGVARLQDSGEATRTLGTMVGTVKYMSPEQVQGRPIDARSDLFSAGVVLYQLLTDHRPFDGDNDFSVIQQIIGDAPLAPSLFNPRLPAAIDAVVARALAKDREERFATARDFAAALQSAVRRAGDTTVLPPVNPTRPPAGGTATTSPSGSKGVTQELELVYWKEIKDSTDAEELQGFLGRFPQGAHADLARRRLRELASAGESPDQTVLSGLDTAASELREAQATEAEPPALAPAAQEARAAGSPRGATAPAPSPAAAPAAPTERRRPLLAMLGSVAAVAVVGLAASTMLGQGGVRSSDSAPASAPSRTASSVPIAGTLVPTVGRDATSSAGAAHPAPDAASGVAVAPQAHPAPLRSAPVARHPASAPVAGPAQEALAEPAAPVAEPAPPPPPSHESSAPRKVAVAAPGGTARAGSPADACRGKVFLAKEFCLAEQCAKPGTRNHPLCVQHREHAKLREESRMRY